MVRIEDRKLIIEVEAWPAKEALLNLQEALLFVLRSQDPELVNSDYNVTVLNFLMEIIPNKDQIISYNTEKK